MKKAILLLLSIIFSGCASHQPRVGVENAGQEVVVSTMDDKSRPKWVTKAADNTFFKDGDDIVSIGIATLNEGSRIDAGWTMAELNAKANVSKTLQSKMEHYAQAASEGTDFGSIDLRSLTSEASKASLSGASVANKFYERVAVTGSDGAPKIEIRFYLQLRISQANYSKALLDAARKDKNPTLSKAFANQVNSHFEQILENDDLKREPTNQE